MKGKERKKGKREEKFEINLQIQPFHFEISCSKYQNSLTLSYLFIFFCVTKINEEEEE